MKLMIVILNDEGAEDVVTALLAEDYRVTRVASTGGFFRRGNTTLFVGTEGDRVERALEIIREMRRTPEFSGHGRATVFVLNVDRYETL